MHQRRLALLSFFILGVFLLGSLVGGGHDFIIIAFRKFVC